MKIAYFLYCFLGFVTATANAQTGVGSPLTTGYAEWIAWSQDPNNLRLPPITDNAKGLGKDFLTHLELRWEGSNEKRLCPDPKLFTRVYRSTNGDKATISYCLRAIDHFREMTRAFELYFVYQTMKDDDERMLEILNDHSEYHLKVMQNDVLKNDYIAFCTIEFYIFIRQKGVDSQAECHSKEIVDKYKGEFSSAFQTAFFFPATFLDLIIKEGSYKTSKEISEVYIRKANNDDWHRLWIYPNLHELGHLALCHADTEAGLDCTKRSLTHRPGSEEEVAADRWAVQALVRLFPEDPAEVLANLWYIVTFQILSMMDFSDHEHFPELQANRLKAIESVSERTYKMLLDSPSLSRAAKKQIKKIVKELQNKN